MLDSLVEDKGRLIGVAVSALFTIGRKTLIEETRYSAPFQRVERNRVVTELILRIVSLASCFAGNSVSASFRGHASYL
jgi:hypothetical protein